MTSMTIVPLKLGREGLAWIIAALVMAAFAFLLFGVAGFRTVAAFLVLFVVTVFFLLKNAALDFEEKVFFSLFAGIGLFPLAAWLVNRAVPSFRLSAVLALAGFVAVGFFAPRIFARLRKQR